MVEQADTRDLKSLALKSVPVRSRSPAPETPGRALPFRGFLHVQQAGIEPIAVEPASGRFRPPVLTLGATSIFAKGKNANRSRSPAPEIPKANAFGIFTYSLFTIHFSLNPTAYPGFLERNK